jgi:hypothetical protein
MGLHFGVWNRAYSFVCLMAVAACGGSDDATGSGGTGGRRPGGNCAQITVCYDRCTCEGKQPNACLSECAGQGGSGGTGGSGTCNNGALDANEECDGVNLGGYDCASATSGAQPTGVLRCTGNCTFDTSGCTGGNTGGGAGFGGGGGQGGGGGFGP